MSLRNRRSRGVGSFRRSLNCRAKDIGDRLKLVGFRGQVPFPERKGAGKRTGEQTFLIGSDEIFIFFQGFAT